MGRAEHLLPVRALATIVVVARALVADAQSTAPAHASTPSVDAPTPPATASTTPVVTPTVTPAAHPPDEGTLVEVVFPGEIQLRYTTFSDIPLAAPAGTGLPASLGQNSYFEHWFRFRPEMRIGERFKIVTEFDFARIVLADNDAQGVAYTPEARNTSLPYGVVQFRQAYAEWRAPFGLVRVGQQTFHWGYGILANDGEHTPVFGDYRYGDLVERVSFATRPAGEASPFVLAVAGDLVYRDRLADLTQGDRAWQGVLAAFYQQPGCRSDCERRRLGVLAVYRGQSFADGSTLEALAGDVTARWEWPQPDRVGKVFAGFELAVISGSTNVASTLTVPTQNILEVGAVGELGIERPGRYHIALEGGYASGDSNPVDDQQRRFTFNPGYRVGLILFPEVLQWQTARSAAIAGAPSLTARVPRGTSLVPTWGGVAGAAYLYPNATIDLGRYFDIRAAMVIAMTTSDNVDPVSTTLVGSPRNYLGGDPTRHDLGVEFDFGLGAHHPMSSTVTLLGGLQGGVLLPGHALDAIGAVGMKPIGLATARAGLQF